MLIRIFSIPILFFKYSAISHNLSLDKFGACTVISVFVICYKKSINIFLIVFDTLHKKWSFALMFLEATTDLVTFTKEILSRKHFMLQWRFSANGKSAKFSYIVVTTKLTNDLVNNRQYICFVSIIWSIFHYSGMILLRQIRYQ